MSRMMGEAELDLDSIPGLTSQQKAALEEARSLHGKGRYKMVDDGHGCWYVEEY